MFKGEGRRMVWDRVWDLENTCWRLKALSYSLGTSDQVCCALLCLNLYAACWWLFGSIQNDAKPLKMIETLSHGYSSAITLRELSNEYQHNRD